jgi:hypothetical protein
MQKDGIEPGPSKRKKCRDINGNEIQGFRVNIQANSNLNCFDSCKSVSGKSFNSYHFWAWVKIKNVANRLSSTRASKRVPYHGDLGFSHGLVGKVTDLHFKSAGSNPDSKLKLSNFHENFCISLFYSLKHAAIIF